MTKKSVLFLVLIIAFALACNAVTSSTPAAPEVNIQPTDVVAAPTEAPPLPLGVSISAGGTSFVIPLGLAGGADFKATPASTGSPNDMPYWEIYPAYIQFDLSGYILQGTFHDARIIIYPANEYAAMNEGAAENINTVKSLLANPNALPQNLPFLPLFNAAQIFHANEKILNFQNGSGIRFLTQYGQAPFPANNHDLFYTFQGITTDGAYYVSMVLPVTVGFLPADGNPDTPLPADGVPFDWNNLENTQAHFELVAQKLNATSPDAFLPTLTSLDALVNSILAGIQ